MNIYIKTAFILTRELYGIPGPEMPLRAQGFQFKVLTVSYLSFVTDLTSFFWHPPETDVNSFFHCRAISLIQIA